MIKYLQIPPPPTHNGTNTQATHRIPKSTQAHEHTKHPSNLVPYIPSPHRSHAPPQPATSSKAKGVFSVRVYEFPPSHVPAPLPSTNQTSTTQLLRHRPAPPFLHPSHHFALCAIIFCQQRQVFIHATNPSLGMYLKKETKKEEVYAALAIRMHARSLIHTLTRYTIPTSTIGLPRTPQKRNEALDPTPIPNARKCTSIASPPRLDSPRSPLPVAIPILILAIVLIVLPPPIPLPLSVLIVSISVVPPSFVIAIALTLLFTLVFVFCTTSQLIILP